MKIAILSTLLFATSAWACECSFAPIDTNTARKASHVFVFRLLKSELHNSTASDPTDSSVRGEIRVVDNLRGVTKARRITYSTLMCCGTRLDVGSYYAAFLKEDAVHFEANSGNVLELGESYFSGSPDREKLMQVLSRSKKLEEVFSEYQRDRTHQIPRPPDVIHVPQ